MNYSPSAISSYKQCPYKFKLSYVDWKKAPSNIYLKKGNFVHGILCEYAKHIMISRMITDTKKLDELIARNKVFPDYKDFTAEDWEECTTMLYGYIKPGLKFEYFQKMEHSFKFWLKSIEANISGRIDRIDMVEDKEVVTAYVIDYKTGKPDDEGNLKKAEGFVFYSWAIKKIIPRASDIWIEFHYLKTGEKVKIKAMPYEEAEKKILEWVAIIKKDKEYKRNETRLCDYCDYRKSGDCVKEENKEKSKTEVPF
jgi:RecB family exonuclease